MQSVRLFCNVRNHTNGVYALIEVPYHMRFVIKHVRVNLYLSGAVV